MAKQLEVRGLDPLVKRMSAYPKKYAKVITKTVKTSLLVIWEKVFPYPPQPSGSSYKRTGQLGRSLGVSEGGGKTGQPDILKVHKLGGGFNYKGKFGTNLGYAADVIGDTGKQKPFFAAYWWRLEQVIGPARPKILKLFDIATKELAKFLEGRGL